MYERGKEISLESTVGLMVKNLQVVSFDSDWVEIYLGTVSLGFPVYLTFLRQIKCRNNLSFAKHFDYFLVRKIKKLSCWITGTA